MKAFAMGLASVGAAITSGDKDLREELAVVERECMWLREADPASPAVPEVYLRFGELHSALGDQEQACRAFGRCAFQTIQLNKDPGLAERCLTQYNLCSHDPWLWQQHRADYHLAQGLLAQERGDLYAALQAFRSAEATEGAPPGRRARALALQFALLRRVYRPDELAAMEQRFVDATLWRLVAPSRVTSIRSATTCGSARPDNLVDLRFLVGAVEDVAFECIRRQALGHVGCEQDLVDTLTRVRASRIGDRATRTSLDNTTLNLAWANFLAGDTRSAGRQMEKLARLDDAEVRLWAHGLRMKLKAAGALAGDWHDELIELEAAAALHDTMESRWLAKVWRGEVARATGDTDAALAAFLAAEDILDGAPLSLGFGASRQAYFTYYDWSARNLADLLYLRDDPTALLDLARRVARRPTYLLLGLDPDGPSEAFKDWPSIDATVHVPTRVAGPPLRVGTLEMALIPGTLTWLAVLADVEERSIVALDLPVEADLSTLTGDPTFLQPLDRWIARNEVIHPSLPGRAQELSLATLPWDEALLSERRRIVHVVPTRAKASPDRPRDTAMVGVFIDPNQVSEEFEDEISSELHNLQDAGWRVSPLIGADAVTHEALVREAPDARLLLLYARGERADASRWVAPDNWDVQIRLGDNPAWRIEDVLAARQVPELVLLIACESGGPGSSSGLLDGLAPVFALRGSRWVLGVTGQMNECVARQFLTAFLRNFDADVDIDVSVAVQRTRLELRAAGTECSKADLPVELARLIVYENQYLP